MHVCDLKAFFYTVVSNGNAFNYDPPLSALTLSNSRLQSTLVSVVVAIVVDAIAIIKKICDYL